MLQLCKKQWKWWAPLLLLAILTPWTPWIDLHAARYFYKEGHFSQNAFLFFLYQHGERAGFAIGGLAGIIFLITFFFQKFRQYRKGMLLIGLTLVIGAGLITNVLCKGYLGRPRPKQLSEFGGQLTYRCFWNPNLNPSRVPQKSLPSGHVAMGFSYLALIVVGRRHELRWLQGIGLCFTLFWGPGLMLARVAQGGHFISDVILAACVMWWTVHVLDLILYQFPWGPLLQSRLNPLSTNGIKNANTTIQNTPKKE